RAALRGERGRRALRWVGVAVAVVLAINVSVRVFGGGVPHPLSPLHLGDKVRALGGLAVHGLGHLLGDPHGDPRAIVSDAARRNGVPVALALSVAHAESRFVPHAISHTGAMGLMQLMPATASELGVLDAFDSDANADGATRYLRALLRRYRGDQSRAVAAYNAGPGRVPSRGRPALPDETRRYVHTVLGASALELLPAVEPFGHGDRDP
ncbi:MAG TPA: lytic transglycosylase domain-containing protein, partial [Polyangiales bacterium]|nr:lytic transglycosylase domain-containing protein [Polyangiales bacterium]